MTVVDAARATLEHRIGTRGRFTLRQPSGEITLRGVEGDTARVRSLDGRPIGESFQVAAGDDFLELRPPDRLGGLVSLGRRGSSPSLDVEVPHGASVTVEATSADVSVSDLTGEKRFRTASGDVSLLRLAGAVDVATVSGEIEIDGQVQLDVVGRTVSGDLSLRLPLARRLDLGTTSGDALVDAELAGEGPFAVRTISGDVTVVARGGLRIEAQTVTGDVGGDGLRTVESARGRRVLAIGRAGSTLTFRSVSGDLAVVSPEGAPPRRDAAERDAAPPVPEPGAPPAPPVPGDAVDDQRLRILRALERGEISVAEAGERLSSLEEVLR